MRKILCLLIGVVAVISVQSYRILLVFPIPTTSHYIISVALTRILLKDGHQITVISPFYENGPNANYTHIRLENAAELSKIGRSVENELSNCRLLKINQSRILIKLFIPSQLREKIGLALFLICRLAFNRWL